MTSEHRTVLSGHKNRRLKVLFLSVCLILSALVYAPGLSGPYAFDDYPNLLNNSYVQIKSLDSTSLYHAAYSLAAGPLKRPISMLSFALNHYFVGSFDDSTPYKLTNLIIHVINGLLIFWLARLVFQRLAESNRAQGHGLVVHPRYSIWIAAGITLLWLVHPIQLTSVLYVVQRMTTLSALFVLTGLVLYFKGRIRMAAGGRGGAWLILAGLVGCGTLAALSKENGILLPLFVLSLELALFFNEPPWTMWRRLSPRSKKLWLMGITALGSAFLAAVIHHALPNYAYRDFTMTERLLTESRVLFFYISLILVPRLNKFGLFHDDIEISTNLVTPWTTLPAVIGIAGLALFAFLVIRKWPLLALGIMWFFTSHLLESSVFALEIAHEHRNYLGTFGILLAVGHVMDRASITLGHNKLWWTLPLMAAAFAGITSFRAAQWSNSVSLFSFEVFHNPESSSAQAGLGMRLAMRGNYDQGMIALRRASDLDRGEAAHLINMQIAASSAGKKLEQADRDEIVNRLKTGHLTPTTSLALQTAGDCILTWCRPLQGPLEEWLRILLAREPSGEYDASMYHYLLGRALFGQGKLADAIQAYRRSHELDPKYLHPLIEVGYLYVRIQRLDDAEKVLRKLETANRLNLHPRDQEIKDLTRKIHEARQAQLPPVNNR